MHVAIAMKWAGTRYIITIIALCMWVCLCLHPCVIDLWCGRVVAAIAPQHLHSAPESSTVHAVAITDSNSVA